MHLLLISASGGDRSSGESHPTCLVVGDGADKSPRLDNSALSVVRERIFGASFGPWSRRRHISHTRQVMEMPEAEGEGMWYSPRARRPDTRPSTPHTHSGGAPGTGVGRWAAPSIDIGLRALTQCGM